MGDRDWLVDGLTKDQLVEAVKDAHRALTHNATASKPDFLEHGTPARKIAEVRHRAHEDALGSFEITFHEHQED